MEYGCIGEKLTHSFSKEIHNLLFDYDYKIQEVPKSKLDSFMTKRDFKAINVTIPYKQAVIPHLHYISDRAKIIGAVNTIVNHGGKLYGYNTDFDGMCALIQKNNIEFKDKNVLVLGSGGTSKTAVAVAQYLGAKRVVRVSRTAKEDCVTYEAAYNDFAESEVFINTTPCGMYPNTVGEPIELERFKCAEAVVDAIYNPLCSNLVIKAKSLGLKATGGLYMLVYQAAKAAELFIDQKVSDEHIDRVYNKIVLSKQNIVLVGMPSSGKTTIGKLLSQNLNMPFVDTDDEIVKSEGKQISEIFAQVGEEGFRDIEQSIIAEVSKRQGCVISTGGGAILRNQNVTALKGNGKIYFIDRPLELLVTTADRPLSSNLADLQKRYDERYDKYLAAADKVIKNDSDIKMATDSIKEDCEK